jgi:hypothetical protein
MHDDEFRDIRTIDPIEGDRLAEEWTSSGAKSALFQAITMSDTPPFRKLHRRSPKRLAALAATLAVAATALVVAGLLPGADTPAYAVRQLENGVIEIKTQEVRAEDAPALEAELREFGIEVDIVTRPATPSVVGEADVFSESMGDAYPIPGLTFAGPDGTPGVFIWRIDPHKFRDRVRIEMYVEAEPGEAYYAGVDPFYPGEVLHNVYCELGDPLPRASDVASRLPDLGITAQWNVITDIRTDSDGGSSHYEPSEEVPQGVITSAGSLNDHTIKFEVVPDGMTIPGWMQPTYSEDINCT